jgi:hypothetical protein
MDDVLSLGTGPSDQEVVRLDVTVDEVLLMDRLNPRDLLEASPSEGKYLRRPDTVNRENSTDHLLGHHGASLDRELSSTHVKEIFHRRTQKIDD